jgi:hypothetical protein
MRLLQNWKFDDKIFQNKIDTSGEVLFFSFDKYCKA